MKKTLREPAPHNLILEYPDLELLEELDSKFQHIAVYSHPELGKILTCDGVVMLAEATFRCSTTPIRAAFWSLAVETAARAAKPCATPK